MKITVNVLGYDNKGLVVLENNRVFHITGIRPDDITNINDSLAAMKRKPLRRFNWNVGAQAAEEKNAN